MIGRMPSTQVDALRSRSFVVLSVPTPWWSAASPLGQGHFMAIVAPVFSPHSTVEYCKSIGAEALL